MIQRKQTLYLLISFILSSLLLYFKFYQAESIEIGASTHILLLPVAALIIVDHVAAILMFKKRSVQRIICYAIIVFLIGYTGAAIMITEQETGGTIRYSLSLIHI